MKKSTAILIALLSFFTGAFFGLLLAPIKGTLGSNNGNTTNNNFYGGDDTSDLETLDGASDNDEYNF